MSKPVSKSDINRRQFLKKGGSIAAGATVLGSFRCESIYAGEDNTIRLALIGCGGRGNGAVGNALNVTGKGPVKLYAMADLIKTKMESSHRALKKRYPDQVDVTEDRQFSGFDAYKKAIDILRPGDVAMCTTRSYIRPLHVEYAVSKGINVFMEKPFASDPGGLHRLLRADEVAKSKNLKVAAGLQCRHSPARQALIEKIRDGHMGEVSYVRANRLGGSRWLGREKDPNNFMNQLQFGKIHLLWVGSGHMVDNLIHQIDECCWIMDAWPVSVVGMGGREPHSTDLGQNLDVYAMEYTYPDGRKAFCGFRRASKTRSEFATFIHGSKCAAQFSGRTHAATVHMFKDQRIAKSNISWTPTKDAKSPWDYEWDELIESIRKDRPHNELRRAVYADLTSLMGRAACHTGQEVTRDQIMASRFQFCDYLDNLYYDSPAPVKADENGQFPFPIPGKWTEV